MYYLFRYKGWEPSKFYWKGLGEKTIIRAFLDFEIEERVKEAEALNV